MALSAAAIAIALIALTPQYLAMQSKTNLLVYEYDAALRASAFHFSMAWDANYFGYNYTRVASDAETYGKIDGFSIMLLNQTLFIMNVGDKSSYFLLPVPFRR